MSVNLTVGEVILVASAVVSVLAWFFRLEGRITNQRVLLEANDKEHTAFLEQNATAHKDIKEDLKYLKQRIDVLVSRRITSE